MTATVDRQVEVPPSGRRQFPRGPVSWANVVFFSAFHLIALSAFWCFSWQALGIAVVLHWLTGSLGICLGYHRLLSHRSLQVPQWLEYFLVTCGAVAMQGGPIFWVGAHRQHHAHAEDIELDPHSSDRGFWWSHMGWLIFPVRRFFDRETYFKFAPDIARDPYYRWLDTWFLLWQIPIAVALYCAGGWPFVVYGTFVRAVALWHCTWFVNSATHFWGYRNFEVEDNARNLWWVGVLAYGEGWHNNHHAHPRNAKAGLHWWEYDPTFWAIWVLQKVGLAKKVHIINPLKAELPG